MTSVVHSCALTQVFSLQCLSFALLSIYHSVFCDHLNKQLLWDKQCASKSKSQRIKH